MYTCCFFVYIIQIQKKCNNIHILYTLQNEEVCQTETPISWFFSTMKKNFPKQPQHRALQLQRPPGPWSHHGPGKMGPLW